MGLELDRDTTPAPLCEAWTMIQTCAHCGGLLGRVDGIASEVKEQIELVIRVEQSQVPACIVTWEPCDTSAARPDCH